MPHRARAALIIVILVALDWGSKVYIRNNVSATDVIPVISPFFNIVHAENPGAAFSQLISLGARAASAAHWSNIPNA